MEANRLHHLLALIVVWVSMVANKTAEVKAAGEAATASLKEATLTRESISGVNMG